MQMDADTHFIRSLGCQYLGPDYDPQSTEARFKPTPYCGCKSLVGNSVYCAEHYPRIYVQGSALRKRHKDLRRKAQIEELTQMIMEIAEELEDEGFEPGMDWQEPDTVER